MTAIAIRNLAERKLRTALTALAIVLGVMMVAGTYVLTDTIDNSFEQIFTQSNEGTDAVVTTKQVIDTDDGSLPAFPASILNQVKQVDGVAEAAGGVADQQVSIIGSDGEPRGGNGAPSLGFSVVPERFDPLTYVEGGPPAGGRRGRDRQGVGRRRGLLRGRPDRDRRQAGGEGVHAGGDRDPGQRRLVRRRDDHRAHPAGGAADHGQGGQARPDQRRRGRRGPRPSSSPRT